VTRAHEAAKTVLQVFALACGFGIVSMITHKAIADISLLAQQHPGDRFWWAFARYLINNLAGG
jgi:hypothetical protein